MSQGDVGYIPQGFGHSIENVGAETARILIVFNSGHYQTIDLSQWIAGNPVDILATNFGAGSRGFRDVSAQGRVHDEIGARGGAERALEPAIERTQAPPSWANRPAARSLETPSWRHRP